MTHNDMKEIANALNTAYEKAQRYAHELERLYWEEDDCTYSGYFLDDGYDDYDCPPSEEQSADEKIRDFIYGFTLLSSLFDGSNNPDEFVEAVMNRCEHIAEQHRVEREMFFAEKGKESRNEY